VAAVLQDAGHAAMRRGAPDSAVGLLRRALAEPPPAERRAAVLVELGRAETMVDGPAAAEHLAAALEATEAPAARARIAELLAKALAFTGRLRESVAVAQRAASELPAELSDERRRLDAHVALAAHFSGDEPAIERLLAPFRAPPLAGDAGTRMLAILAATEMALAAEPAQACADLIRAALADDVLLEADDGVFSVGAVRVLALADDAEALGLAERLRLDAHRRGSGFGMLAALLWHGFALLRRGELEDAAASLRSSEEERERWLIGAGGDRFGVPMLARVLLEQGDATAARATLARMDVPPFASSSGRWWRAVDLEPHARRGPRRRGARRGGRDGSALPQATPTASSRSAPDASCRKPSRRTPPPPSDPLTR
jgi:hypothetical protein